jgi:hypothetical protein
MECNSKTSALKEPEVTATFEHNNKTFRDVNPTARPESRRTGERIPNPGNSKGLTAVNNTTTKMHAEIGALYQSYMDGNRGGSGTLVITGKKSCKFCRQDIKKMAKMLNLDELIVLEEETKKITKFNEFKDFEIKKDGGKTW